jgi:ribosomal protein S27AE
MYERMVAWRRAHPGASFDEIVEQVGWERRALMGQLMSELATQNQLAVEALSTECPKCAEETEGKGQKERMISHMEGETTLKRGYRYCAKCGSGFFPPGRGTEANEADMES